MNERITRSPDIRESDETIQLREESNGRVFDDLRKLQITKLNELLSKGEAEEGIANRIREFAQLLRSKYKASDLENRLLYRALIGRIDVTKDFKLVWNKYDFKGDDSILEFVRRGFNPVSVPETETKSYSALSSQQSESPMPDGTIGSGSEGRESLEHVQVNYTEVGFHAGKDNTCGAYFRIPGGVNLATSPCPKCKEPLDWESAGYVQPARGKGADQVDRNYFFTNKDGRSRMLPLTGVGKFRRLSEEGYERDEQQEVWHRVILDIEPLPIS